jgi:hypothetical protein
LFSSKAKSKTDHRAVHDYIISDPVITASVLVVQAQGPVPHLGADHLGDLVPEDDGRVPAKVRTHAKATNITSQRQQKILAQVRSQPKTHKRIDPLLGGASAERKI